MNPRKSLRPLRVESGQSCELVEITPEIAADMLERNPKNRKLGEADVVRYGTDMVNGNWDVTGDTIKIAWDDTIIDGQHRLVAAVRFNVSFVTWIIYGAAPEVRRSVDRGKPRKLRDYLGWAASEGVINVGVIHASDLAAAITAAWRLETNPISGSPPTDHQAIEWLEKNPEIVWAVNQSKRVWKGTRLPRSVVAAVLYEAHIAGAARHVLEEFVNGVCTGLELYEGSPAYALRRWAERDQRGGRKAKTYVHAAIFAKAWNAYYDGRTIKNLSWRRGGDVRANAEPFPAIRPNQPLGHHQRQKARRDRQGHAPHHVAGRKAS